MESTEKALVLKVGRFREVDVWVRLFSARKGIFSAFAFGGSVSRRRFLGCLDPFNLVTFKIRSDTAKGYIYLLEGSLIAAHPRLRRDAERLGMAVNCLKFLEAAHLGPSGSEAAYDLTLKTLSVLDRSDSPTPVLPLFFRARMAFDQGFRPEFSSCARCGANLCGNKACSPPDPDLTGAMAPGPLPARLLVEQGKLLCGDCRQWARGPAVLLSRESLTVLRALCSQAPERWADIEMSAQARVECGRALEQFVEHHLGLTWDHGSFRRI
jgi:DNA repair protein RecO (recombination protein O)